jgi:hypothetical protein
MTLEQIRVNYSIGLEVTLKEIMLAASNKCLQR